MRAKLKGNRYELDTIKLMKQLGWELAASSRAESRVLDSKGVDIVNTYPFLIQCKAWESAPSYHKVLESMPKSDDTFRLLFHKRNNKGTVVVMTQEDFVEILQMLITSNKISPC